MGYAGLVESSQISGSNLKVCNTGTGTTGRCGGNTIPGRRVVTGLMKKEEAQV